ncbi:GHKL domain-containing protein [Lachnospiraceae bacterium MD308]|nr:GHKL domain-containing protein [Lachnospiraceae bacterium MD308]
MIGIQICVEWLVTFVESFFYFSIIHVLAPTQFKKKKQIIMFLAVANIITVGVILLNFIDISFSLVTIVYGAFAYSFGACILFQGNYFSFLFVAVVYLTGLNFVEGSILRFIEDITGYAVSAQLQAGFSNMRLYLIILFKLVDGLIIWIVRFILKRATVQLGKVRIALAGAVLGFVSATYWMSTNIVTNFKTDLFQAILALAFVFIICSAYFYYRLCQIRKEQENIALQNELLAKNYQVAKESYESNARLYHDMGNHFSMIQSYLADGKVEEARTYLDRLGKDRAAYSVERFTGIEAVDYILSQKAAFAKQQNVETSIHAEYPKDCKIDPVDLCTILTNLLDNAMEACGKLPEASAKILSVTIRRINQFIIIQIANSCIEEPVISKGNFKTSKTDKRHHGWGMKNVRLAVEKYHGTMEYEYNKNMFIVSVMLFYQ